jgi:hypothetical protein
VPHGMKNTSSECPVSRVVTGEHSGMARHRSQSRLRWSSDVHPWGPTFTPKQTPSGNTNMTFHVPPKTHTRSGIAFAEGLPESAFERAATATGSLNPAADTGSCRVPIYRHGIGWQASDHSATQGEHRGELREAR